MRVQRAPLAAEQPQHPPSMPAPFFAGLDLDLTLLATGPGRPRLVAEVVVRLVAACRAEGLIDDTAPLRVVRPSGRGLVGVRLDPAVRQSATAIAAALDAPAARLPAPTRDGLAVVDLGAAHSRTIGDWGLGGVVVATLGPAVPTLVSRPQADGSGLGLAQRQLAALGIVVPNAKMQGYCVVRALEAVARSVERPGPVECD